MGMEGHNVVLGVQDEIQVFGQQELPLAEATMAEHKRLTGHEPLETQNPKGWFCYHYDLATHTSCTAAWPPPTPAEARMEEMAADLMRTGRHERDGLVVEYMMDVPILGDPNRINKRA